MNAVFQVSGERAGFGALGLQLVTRDGAFQITAEAAKEIHAFYSLP